MASMNRTIRGSVDITTVCVRAPPRKYLTPYKVVQAKLFLWVFETVLLELFDLRTLGGPHLSLNLPPKTFYHRGGQYPFGCPPDPDDRVQLGPPQPHGYGRGQVAFGPNLDARPGLPYFLDKTLVPFPV